MRKVISFLVFGFILVMNVMSVYPQEDQDWERIYRKEYENLIDRPAWVYKFNSVANFITQEIESIGTYYFSRMSFDLACISYKVLLDIGVERGYIDDKIKQQRLDMLKEKRNIVSEYLAKQSGRLGL